MPDPWDLHYKGMEIDEAIMKYKNRPFPSGLMDLYIKRQRARFKEMQDVIEQINSDNPDLSNP